MSPSIHIPKEKIVKYCQEHNITRLSVFGSALRDDFRPDSDVDLLVVLIEAKNQA